MNTCNDQFFNLFHRNFVLYSSLAEPGYYEDGQFGVRIENIVLIKPTTTEVLRPSLKFHRRTVPFHFAVYVTMTTQLWQLGLYPLCINTVQDLEHELLNYSCNTGLVLEYSLNFSSWILHVGRTLWTVLRYFLSHWKGSWAKQERFIDILKKQTSLSWSGLWPSI